VTHRRLLRLAQACHRLLHLHRVSGCFGTSRGLSRDTSSTTSPRACSSSTTSPPPRVWVPRHVARLVTRLVVDYFASRRLVIDYVTYATRPVASARRAACRVTHRRLLHLAPDRRRLLRLRRTSGYLGTSHGSSRGSSSTISPRSGSSSTTSPASRVWLLRHVTRHIARLIAPLVVDYFFSRRLVVDYFTYAARQVASARHTACRVTHRRLLRLAPARPRLLRLHRAPLCLGMSRGTSCGSSRGSSLTTSPRAGSSSTTSHTPRARLLRHIARLIA
jgi:hypothetical protein